MRGGGSVMDDVPAAGDLCAKRPQSEDSACKVEQHLDDVGPDDSSEAALEGVDQREDSEDEDGGDGACAEGDGDDNGDGEDADAFRGGACGEEDAGGEAMQ